MIKLVILVFVGGALGSVTREFIMLGVPNLADGFPLDILVANLMAALLLGIATALHRRRLISAEANILVGTGMMGGLSTFSSFVYGADVLMSTSIGSAAIASAYVLISLIFGYIAIVVGLGRGRASGLNPLL